MRKYLTSTSNGQNSPLSWALCAEIFAEIISLKLKIRNVAFQFVLEEVEAASKGNDEAKSFAANSGIPENEYSGALQNSIPLKRSCA